MKKTMFMATFFNAVSLSSSTTSLVVLLGIVVLGLVLGKIKVRGASIGVICILFAGIAYGAVGGTLDGTVLALFKELGLAAFIFSIGFQVGPSFFSSFRREGAVLNILAFAVVAIGVAVTLLISYFRGDSLSVLAGVYSGAISSTPGMSAAMQAEVTEAGSRLIATSYAVTYPIGVIVPIISCIVARKICRVNLNTEPFVREEMSSSDSGSTTVFDIFTIIPFLGGILAGLLLGAIPFRIGNLPEFKLGSAGGPLFVSIFVGFFTSKFKNKRARLSEDSVALLRDLGLTMFLSSVGIEAGSAFIPAIMNGGYIWIMYALIISFVPLFVVVLFARFVLKMNFYTLMGVVGGATTDTPALAYANSVANNRDNRMPATAYSTVYPLTVFLRIITSQMLVLMAV